MKILKGERKDECFVLGAEKVVVGRGVNSSVQIFDHGLSRLHFSIEARGADFVIRDLESSNGTYLNGRRIREAVLRAGDLVTSGETEFRILDANDTAATTVRVSADEHQSTVDYVRRKKPHIEGLTSDILLSQGKVQEETLHKTLLALTTMYKVGNAIQSERDPRRLFEVILTAILEVIDAERGFLLLLDEKTGAVEAVAHRVLEGADPSGTLSISRTILDESVKNGLSTISSDAMSDRRFQAQDSVCMHNIRSVMSVPLEGQARILGAIYVDNQATKAVFTEDQLELLSAIGRQSGIALERALLEEEIRRSEERFRSFIENSPDAIVETTLEGQVLSFNEQALRLFGYTPEEMKNLPAAELYYDAKTRAHVIEQYQLRGFLRNHEIEVKDAQGRRIICTVSGRLVRDQKTGEHKIESIIRDVSKRKNLENALIKSEERYRKTFERTPAVIATVDANGFLDDLNEYGCEALGVTRDAVKAGTIQIGELLGLTEQMSRLLRGGRAFEENDVPVQSGEREAAAYFNVRGAAFRDAKGNVSGAVILAKDITQQKELQAQIFQQEKMASIGLLAAGIAHEFNNLLASMMGYAQLAGKKQEFDHEKFRQVVLKQTARGKQIVDSLMSFSRQGGYDRSYASVNEVLEDCLLLVHKELEKNNIDLVRELRDVARTCINVGEIQQVFLNLVINASQSMSNGGKLTISTRDDAGRIYVSFTDTGTGIPRELLGRIFQPFFTTKGPIGKSKTPGTGLGLSVSYNIVARHGGDLVVESEIGIGSTFTINLPIALPDDRASTRRIELPSEEVAEPDLGLEILVVDDEPSILEVFQGLFEKNRVRTVQTGREAILEFARRRFDLVFLDVMMPGEFGGLDTLDRLKTVSPEARVVLMTGQVEPERIQSHMRKAEGLIQKPFSNRDVYRYLLR